MVRPGDSSAAVTRTPPLGLCDCCGDEPAVGVACVPGMPVSIAWGRKCLEAEVAPYGLVVANTAMIGGVKDAAPWWREMVERTLAYFKKTELEFETDVKAAIAEMPAEDPQEAEAAAPVDEVELPPTKCPFCDHPLDRALAGSRGGREPKPGDVSVCISCASALVFTEDLNVRPMTPAEVRALDAVESAMLRKMQRAVRSIDRTGMKNDEG